MLHTNIRYEVIAMGRASVIMYLFVYSSVCLTVWLLFETLKLEIMFLDDLEMNWMR